VYSGYWTFTYGNNTLYGYTASHNNANRQTVEHTNEREAGSNAKRRGFRATGLVFCIPGWTLDRADNRKIPNEQRHRKLLHTIESIPNEGEP